MNFSKYITKKSNRENANQILEKNLNLTMWVTMSDSDNFVNHCEEIKDKKSGNSKSTDHFTLAIGTNQQDINSTVQKHKYKQKQSDFKDTSDGFQTGMIQARKTKQK